MSRRPLRVPLPSPPSPPDSVPLSRQLRDWFNKNLLKWCGDMVRALDVDFMAIGAAAFQQAMFCELALTGFDGATVAVSFPYVIAMDQNGVPLAELWDYTGATPVRLKYVSGIPADGEWGYEPAATPTDQLTGQPTPSYVLVGKAYLEGDDVRFGWLVSAM